MANCKVIAVTNQKGGVGKSIFAHDKNGKVAAAYRSLTKEVSEQPLCWMPCGIGSPRSLQLS